MAGSSFSLETCLGFLADRLNDAVGRRAIGRAVYG